jgi:hypothetical protein
MRKFIRKVLGEAVPDGDVFFAEARHGPGGTIKGRGTGQSKYDKYADWPYTVTPKCAPYARSLIQNDPRWLGALEDSYRTRFHIPMWSILNWNTFWDTVLCTVEGNRITTVPKDVTIDRPIAIEPTINMMVQLGVDAYIRRRLRRWGVDLNDQTLNCRLAREGSLSDQLVTIDLSSASDTISLRLVKLLLPSDWYQFLCDLRSPKGTLPSGSVIRYRKISSMGNGFTFALESLIFTAIQYASHKLANVPFVKGKFAVYGDDLICHRTVSYPLLRLLDLSGFIPNRSKSFLQGPFRESCGTDWYCGHYVRPAYAKSLDRIDQLAAVYNRLRYWAYQVLGDSDALVRTLGYILSLVPTGYIVMGPEDEFYPSSWFHSSSLATSSVRGYAVKSVKRRPREWFFALLLHSHRVPATGGTLPHISGLRRQVETWRLAERLGLGRHTPLVTSLMTSQGSVYVACEKNLVSLRMRRLRPEGQSYRPFTDLLDKA